MRTPPAKSLWFGSGFVVIGLLGTAGSWSAAAQGSDQERIRELEEELLEVEARARELRREVVRRRLDDTRDRLPRVARMGVATGPGYLALLSRRGRLGITVKTRADEESDLQGAVIEGVLDGGPASSAGLEAGDIITHWDGEPLVGRYPAAAEGESEAAVKLLHFARQLEAGDRLELTYRRDGREERTTIEAAKLDSPVISYVRPAEVPTVARLRVEAPALAMPIWVRGRWGEMEVVKVNPELGEYFGTDRGLLVIEPPDDGELELRAGDVILSIGDREPRDASHAMRILRSYEPGETIHVVIMRRQQRQTLSLTVPEAERWGRLPESRTLLEGALDLSSGSGSSI